MEQASGDERGGEDDSSEEIADNDGGWRPFLVQHEASVEQAKNGE